MNDPMSAMRPDEVDEQPDATFAHDLWARIAAVEARNERSTTQQWHLAELNLGVFKAPLDAPEMAPFVDALDPINAIADAAPGFIWRMTDADGGPSSNVEVPGATDPLLASNLSVWADFESLRDFMYRTDHASYLRRRAEWFDRDRQPMTVAWWIPAGTLPTLPEALHRLDHLRKHGPTGLAFPLGRTVPPAPSDTTKEPAMSPTITSSVIPYLTVADSRAALAFYAEVFGATPRGELFEMDDGSVGHAEFEIGTQLFYMADEFPTMKLQQPASVGSNSVSLVLMVDDADATYEHAVLAGATGERAPADQHGFRSGWFVDPWGHRWSPTSTAHADLTE